MIGDHHLKAQDLVIPRAQEYARKTHFEPTIELPFIKAMIVIVPMAFVLLWIRYRRGSVYKGVLRSGTAIAVKVFNLDAAFKSFDTECEVLRSLHHRNLVKVITSCSNLDFKALVVEYIPNGSLEKYLYSHNYFLDIKQRLSIMIDVACALEYLHHGCSLPVIHCDVKPSNVLLDEDMVAHLSDFGISKFLGEYESDLYTKTLATLGYIGPEYGKDGLVSTKCDVYSYGIMLLETFTRRKPNNFEGDLSLKQWVSHSLSEAVMDVIDIHLVTPTDLGSNNFHGNLPQEMARLRRLKFLDLSVNNFRGEVPSWLGFLHQLRFLSLRNNSFNGSIPSSFSNISELETLNLKFNSIEGQIPKVIGNILNLRVLNLGGNKLVGLIPTSLLNASRLEILEISYNSLQGNIPEEIGNLHNMNWLSIQYNQLTGSIPFTIFNISRMEFIAFTGNSLSGSLPNGLCNGLPILKGLYLSYNKLHGMIPQEIVNFVNLVELAMAKNQITGSVPTSIFNISSLQLLSQWQNNLRGFLPREIGNLTKMQHLELSGNKLIGEIPKEISNLVELKELDLGRNSFSGSLDMEIFNISGLKIIYLSFNNLSGSLPPNLGSILPNIEELYLRNLTNLVGTIPHSISNCSKLTILELSNNQLTGLIPNSLGYLTHLQILNLGGNNLTSDSSLSFLTSLTNWRNLKYLYLFLNPLNGMLPVSVGNFSTSLIKFYASSCKIRGRIPDEVGYLNSLFDLDLTGNNLAGSIPTSNGNLRNLQGLFLSNNKLTGSIGDNLCKLQRLNVIDLTQNQLSGSLPNCLGKVTSLREIHVGSNILSSNTLQSLGNLKDLVVLDLSSNNMVGSLPPEIGNLKAATLIDLSMNQFSDGIPREIGGLQNLVQLSLRHNNLQGAIPDSMSNMVVVVPSTFIFLWIRYRKGKRAPQQADSLSAITRERIPYYELIQATDALSESNLIGSGSFGSVYKGVLKSGTAIAVKVFNLQLDAAFKSFDTECEVLCTLRHRNLV
ncbi:putative LRR receptor-like serine/threonine-protein kinase-like [Capsicum annuum]|nr:putative LRR receptor-like serine/threonine-protein kinase-like [Capsicum annuum]